MKNPTQRQDCSKSQAPHRGGTYAEMYNNGGCRNQATWGDVEFGSRLAQQVKRVEWVWLTSLRSRFICFLNLIDIAVCYYHTCVLWTSVWFLQYWDCTHARSSCVGCSCFTSHCILLQVTLTCDLSLIGAPPVSNAACVILAVLHTEGDLNEFFMLVPSITLRLHAQYSRINFALIVKRSWKVQWAASLSSGYKSTVKVT